MNKEILDRLDTLAAKLGVTVNHLWGVLLRQARVEAMSDICWLVASGLGFVFCWHIFWSALRNHDNTELMMGKGIVGTIGGLVAVIVFLYCAMSLPTELLNPEYWALDRILHYLR